jgi:hypothetical protein
MPGSVDPDVASPDGGDAAGRQGGDQPRRLGIVEDDDVTVPDACGKRRGDRGEGRLIGLALRSIQRASVSRHAV